MIMLCLSVRQPWAWAIVEGHKPFENRPRRYHHRGPILIQASKGITLDEYEAGRRAIFAVCGKRAPQLPAARLGAILGAVMLTGCEEPLAQNNGWRVAGQFGLKLERAVKLPPRPYSGALGLFKVELTGSEELALRRAGLLA